MGTPGSTIVGVDTYPDKNEIYYTDQTHKAVYKIHGDGTGLVKLVGDLSSPHDIVLDTVNLAMYWTDMVEGAIHVASMIDGSNHKVIATGYDGIWGITMCKLFPPSNLCARAYRTRGLRVRKRPSRSGIHSH